MENLHEDDRRRIEMLVTSWEEFHRAQNTLLRRIAGNYRLSEDQMEDVIQETWLKTLRNLHRFDEEGAERRLRSWMRCVMHSLVMDALRRLCCRRAKSLQTLPAELEPSEQADKVAEDEHREWLSARLAEAGVEDSLNYQLLCKHYLEGRSIGKLAAETGLTQDAIDSRIRREVRKLRARAMEDGLAGEAVR